MGANATGDRRLKPFFFLLGWCSFGLGAVGVVVPGLPTVPLMLLALWSFSRSSQRFHDWLYHHRIFGPPLQEWRAHRVIPVRAKIVAVLTMTISLAWMTIVAEMPIWLKSAVAAMILGAAVYVVTRPSRPAAATIGEIRGTGAEPGAGHEG
jgi:uncharacterized membrane protein YbaN (DUF454 family)